MSKIIQKTSKIDVIRSKTEDLPEFLKFADFEEIRYEDKSKIDIKNFVIQDSREKRGWNFVKGEYISGVEVDGLKTGDYTIKGFEKDFVIERKGSTSEIAQNIFQERFEKELIRLEEFKYPYLICEFDFDDLVNFPVNSGIPPKLWKKVKTTGKYLVSAFMRYQVVYKTKFILAGSHGMEVAESLFKMMVRHAK